MLKMALPMCSNFSHLFLTVLVVCKLCRLGKGTGKKLKVIWFYIYREKRNMYVEDSCKTRQMTSAQFWTCFVCVDMPETEQERPHCTVTKIELLYPKDVGDIHCITQYYARNFLETRENIKISTHPFYHINLGWFSLEWSKKNSKWPTQKKLIF